MSRFRPIARTAGLRRSTSGNVLRPVEWIRDCDGPFPIPASASGALGAVLVEVAEFEDFTRPTVVRIRGELQLWMSDISVASNAVVAYGITIVNPNEPAPDPFVQRRGNRWLWWGCSFIENPPGEVTLVHVDAISYMHIPFDVKSMRKRLVDGSNLQLCASTAIANVSGFVSASTLVKE